MFIGVPKNSSFYDEAVQEYESLGLDLSGINPESRVYNQGAGIAKAFLLRPQDLPWAYFEGDLDMGITGKDILLEYTLNRGMELDDDDYRELGFGGVDIVFASDNDRILEGDGVTIATSYPNIADEYLSQKYNRYEVIEGEGSIEVFPAFSSVDGVIEVSDSGSTLRENGLQVVDKLLSSEAVMLGQLNGDI